MYEPITVVKVRKPTKLTIPAGGWMLLIGPDQPLHEHLARVEELHKQTLVNEDFSSCHVGRMQDVKPVLEFMTAEEAEALKKRQEENSARLAQANKDATERERQQAADEKKKAEEEHQKQVSEINRFNDSIRNQGQRK